MSTIHSLRFGVLVKILLISLIWCACLKRPSHIVSTRCVLSTRLLTERIGRRRCLSGPGGAGRRPG